MMVGCLVTIVAAFMQAFAPKGNLGCFIAGRVIIGVGQGIALSETTRDPPSLFPSLAMSCCDNRKRAPPPPFSCVLTLFPPTNSQRPRVHQRDRAGQHPGPDHGPLADVLLCRVFHRVRTTPGNYSL